MGDAIGVRAHHLNRIDTRGQHVPGVHAQCHVAFVEQPVEVVLGLDHRSNMLVERDSQPVVLRYRVGLGEVCQECRPLGVR